MQPRVRSHGLESCISMAVLNHLRAERFLCRYRAEVMPHTADEDSRRQACLYGTEVDHNGDPMVRTPQVIVAWTEVNDNGTIMGSVVDQLVRSDNRPLQSGNPTTRQRLRERPEARHSSFVTVVTTAVSPASRESRWTLRYESANVESV